MKLTHPNTRREGFTLIELLIVVAIIAILAAIAVPNVLEAQVRSKVSRSRADLKSLATALEAYMVDYNRYPENTIIGTYSYLYVPNTLTTPVSYITAGAFYDVFRQFGKDFGTNPASASTFFDQAELYNSRYIYLNTRYWLDYAAANPGTSWVAYNSDGTTYPWIPRSIDRQGAWYLSSYGPDLKYGPEPPQRSTAGNVVVLYDPTNGTVSPGDIVRTQRDTEGSGVGRPN